MSVADKVVIYRGKDYPAYRNFNEPAEAGLDGPTSPLRAARP